MNIDSAAIIAKIKKCLALSRSSNEHEAASALRQAQLLMREHGITDLDIEHADILEDVARSRASSKPATWECRVASMIAIAFGCEMFFRGRISPHLGEWRFVGFGPSAEIARYAFEVLMRQVKRARANHINTALKRCGAVRRAGRVAPISSVRDGFPPRWRRSTPWQAARRSAKGYPVTWRASTSSKASGAATAMPGAASLSAI